MVTVPHPSMTSLRCSTCSARLFTASGKGSGLCVCCRGKAMPVEGSRDTGYEEYLHRDLAHANGGYLSLRS